MNYYFLTNGLVHEKKDEKETKCGLSLSMTHQQRRVSKVEMGTVLEVDAPVTCNQCKK